MLILIILFVSGLTVLISYFVPSKNIINWLAVITVTAGLTLLSFIQVTIHDSHFFKHETDIFFTAIIATAIFVISVAASLIYQVVNNRRR